METQIRLQKYLSDCGITSRRAAEVLIADGKVTVNGIVAVIGTKITPDADEVRLDGNIVAPKSGCLYIALHKPAGVITSAADQFGRKTVVDLVADIGERVYPVGRLDYATNGLILLTNDGEIANKLLHPRHGVEKVYDVKLARHLSAADVHAFKQGIVIDRRLTRPAVLEISPRDKRHAHVILQEGRNRQVRKMFTAIGNRVVSLTRVAIGPIELGNLKIGEYRRLTAAEIAFLKRL